MDKKCLWFDTETTGLDPVRHDIIQLAGMVEINGRIVNEFNYMMQPFRWDNLTQEALNVNGRTIEEIKTYPSPQSVYSEFMDLLSEYVDKFDRNDKYYQAGYNVRFDIEFLSNWFKKNGDKYYGSWFNGRYIDPLQSFYLRDYLGKISLDNYKLATVAGHYGILLDAHDALADIKATRDLFMAMVFPRREAVTQ